MGYSLVINLWFETHAPYLTVMTNYKTGLKSLYSSVVLLNTNYYLNHIAYYQLIQQAFT